MTRYTYWLIALICLFSTVRANAFEIQPTTPDLRASIFDAIKTAPTNSQDLTPYYSMNQDGDGIGEELPSSIMYFKRNTNEYTTYMTVTDLSLCKRPIERRICQSFVKMITEAPPALGTEVSDTRIGGADFGTVYLSRIDSVKLDGVDISTAFIGIDSQDPPRGTIAL